MREMNLGEHRANVDVARVQAMRRNKPPDQVERQMTQSFNLRHKQIADGFEKQFAEHNFGLARMKRAVSASRLTHPLRLLQAQLCKD